MSISTLVRPDVPVISDVPVTDDPMQEFLDTFVEKLMGPEPAKAFGFTDLVPFTPTPMEPVSVQLFADLARRAADEVEMRGWTRHKVINCAGQVCAMGAIISAVRDDLMGGWDSSDQASHRASEVVELLGVRFADWLGAWGGVPNWNDGHQKKPSRVPSPRSAMDVAAAFRGFADALLAGEA